MIVGIVSSEFRPLIHLRVEGLHGKEQEVEAWIDTGFNGALLVPPDVVIELELVPNFAISVKLADGSETEMVTYTATVAWNNAPQQIQILSADHHALIGLALLQNHQLNAEVGALFAKRQKKEDCHSRAGGNP